MKINAARVKADLEKLAEFGRTDRGITRPTFSEADLACQEMLKAIMVEYGMKVYTDAVGNLIGRWEPPGTEGKPAIAVGSHTDTVPNGGPFDGALGVIAGVECVRALSEAGHKPNHPIEVIAFAEEEGYHLAATFGSRAMMGEVKREELDKRKASNLPTLAEAFRKVGLDPDRLHEAKRDPGEFLAYYELHIEQGSTLEDAGETIGVVEGIVGVWRFNGHVTGFPSHAGTTPMDKRNDALVNASRLFIHIHETAKSMEGIVATVGQVGVDPGVVNVIPGQIDFSLEMRSLDESRLADLRKSIEDFLSDNDFGTLNPLVLKPPSVLDERLRNLLAETCQEGGYSWRHMPSAAGHDAQVMARHLPSAMLFVPSVDGLSHCPQEWTEWEDVYAGVQCMVDAVVRTDRADWL